MKEQTGIHNDIVDELLQMDGFLDQMPGGFFIYRADGNEEIIYANKAMLRLFDCATMEEFQVLTGNSFRGIVHPDDLEAVEESIAEQIRHSQYDLDYVEYRIIQRGGAIRWVDDYGHFVHSDEGDIFYVFVGDATEKKQRQEALLVEKKQHEEQLKNKIEEYDQELEVIHQEHLRRLEMIEGLSVDYESIFYVDLDAGRIKPYRVSPRFKKDFPVQRKIQEFAGYDSDYIRKWVHPEDRTLLSGASDPAYIREKLAKAKTFHINYRIIQEEKTTYMQLRMVNVSNEEQVSQVILGYRNVDVEIIQEMKQKQVLEKALEEANRANSAKTLFLSNMSHDIRTPLNAIVGYTALARKYMQEKEKISQYLDMVTASSDQLLRLLNDVLEISRIESGKIYVQEEEFDLPELMHQIQSSMLYQAEAKELTLSLRLSGLKHHMVFSDRKKMSQVLTCLLDNAVKYTNPRGQICIIVTEGENTENGCIIYQFIIEDNGIGISKEFSQLIFEPFERKKNTTMSGIYGTGLGLTIARKLLEMLGGTIEVSSVSGQGSKFTITLPLRIREGCEEEGENGEKITEQSGPGRVLIVDDNDINLEIEIEVMKDAGFQVDTAKDGSIAVEKVGKSAPGYYDLILMDIQMPVMDGLCATRAIRALEEPSLARIPIIAVSANAFEEDRKRAIESGMNEHLAKPIDVALLVETAEKFIREGREKAG